MLKFLLCLLSANHHVELACADIANGRLGLLSFSGESLSSTLRRGQVEINFQSQAVTYV